MKNDLPFQHARGAGTTGAAALARCIAAGESSAVEVMERHIERAREVQPALNAMAAERFDAARAEAREADARRARGEALGPLHGVPFTVKDSLDLRGLPSTFGLPSRSASVASQDEVHVARLRAAGAIPFAKGNVAQALFFYEADNPLHGRTLHPLDPARTPGGSSGGDAVLVATGASPLALGTDLGGSVRVPAAFTGLCALKPTGGRCDDLGRFSAPVGQRAIASQVGAIARSVEDVALAMQIANGGAHPPPPGQPFADWRDVSVRGLRVAWYTDDGTFAVSPAIARGVREAAALLEAAGAQVTPWTPPDAVQALRVVYAIYAAGMDLLARRMGPGPRHPALAQLFSLSSMPRGLVRVLQPLLRAVGQPTLAANLTPFGYRDATHYFELVEAQLEYRERFAHALDTAPGGPFDLIVCPACALPALPHGATKDLATAGAYACLYNLLGYPAGVVPVTQVRQDEQEGRPTSRDLVMEAARRADRASAGLPVGVQVVARPWQEHVALAAMAAIEQARPSLAGAGRSR